VYEDPVSGPKRAALYILSLLVPLFGIVVGVMYMDAGGETHRSVGARCMILGAVCVVVMPVVLAAVMYFMVLGM